MLDTLAGRLEPLASLINPSSLMKQAKYRFLLLPLAAVLALIVLVALPAQAAPDPDKPTPPVGWVQARVFRNLVLQDFKLEGVLHTKTKIYPLTLKTKDRQMVYLFKEEPLQIRVTLDPTHAAVDRRTSSSEPWQPVTGKALTQHVLDTDITYEDLGMSFIFWDRVTGLGSDSIKTLPAWAFEALPPEGSASAYAKARYWISTEYFAFLRVDAYDAKGDVVKRVEVNGVQQIGDAYAIKEMVVATMLPGRDLSASRTFIEVRSGAPGSGL